MQFAFEPQFPQQLHQMLQLRPPHIRIFLAAALDPDLPLRLVANLDLLDRLVRRACVHVVGFGACPVVLILKDTAEVLMAALDEGRRDVLQRALSDKFV